MTATTNTHHHNTNTLTNRGLETCLCLESQVSSFFVSFLLLFYNDFLHLDFMYVSCEGDDGRTPPPIAIPRLGWMEELETRGPRLFIYFFHSFFSLTFFTISWHVLELRRRWWAPHLNEQGTRDADASRVPGKFFFLLFFFLALLMIFRLHEHKIRIRQWTHATTNNNGMNGGARDADASWVPGKFFSFFFLSTNDFFTIRWHITQLPPSTIYLYGP